MFTILVLFFKLCSLVSSKEMTLEIDPDNISDESKLSIEDVPFMVSVHNTIAAGEVKEKVCTGFLIDTHWILTSAHCFDGGKIVNTLIKFGIDDYSLNTKNTVPPKTIIIHPDYNNRSIINDLALIHVRMPKLNKVVYIMVDDAGFKWNQDILEKKKCLAIGYGKINYNDTRLYLKKLTVRYDPQGCGCFITNRELLCGTPISSASGICYEDFGGPLICNGLVVGMANQLLQCDNTDDDCSEETYHRYTNLCPYFQWIHEHVDVFSDVCYGYNGSKYRAIPAIHIILVFILIISML